MKKIWFDSQPRNAIFKKYLQSSVDVDLAFMSKSNFYSLLIDLNQDEEIIFSKCTQNCRNEIKRGGKLGLIFQYRTPTQADAKTIDDFLKVRGLGKFNQDYLREDGAIICSVEFDGVMLASHLYIRCLNVGRVRLLYSVLADVKESILPEISGRRLVGIANRFLHYSAINYFKFQGFLIYDFGGVVPNSCDKKIVGINDFKSSFGGVLVKEFNYVPILISKLANNKPYIIGHKFKKFVLNTILKTKD